MRLIDADALERHVYTEWVNGELSNSEWIDFREWLKDEPTVEPASPWHRVEEELPKQSEWVLVKSCLVRMMTDFIDKTGRWYRTPGVTHWMTLPEPPKEDA